MTASGLGAAVLKAFDWRSRSGQRALAGASAVLIAIAAVLVFVVFTGQKHAPRPSQAAAVPLTGSKLRAAEKSAASSATTAAKPSATKTKKKKAPFVPRTASGSTPVEIDIPTLGVQADVESMGLNADNTVQVPPLSQVGVAGWYKYSPVPGQRGPSVIVGHIDSAVYGRGVFFDLGALHRGASVTVVRADHMVATFVVTQVVEYPKSSFPTEAIYGNTSNAALRLITCGGRFDPAKRSYVDNIVAFATLASLRHQ